MLKTSAIPNTYKKYNNNCPPHLSKPSFQRGRVVNTLFSDWIYKGCIDEIEKMAKRANVSITFEFVWREWSKSAGTIMTIHEGKANLSWINRKILHSFDGKSFQYDVTSLINDRC